MKRKILLIILLYILPAIYSLYWISKSHSPNGRWSNEEWKVDEMVMPLIPVANIGVCIGVLTTPPTK